MSRPSSQVHGCCFIKVFNRIFCHLPRQTWEGEEHLPSWMSLFLLNQIAQAAVKNNSKSRGGLWARMNMAVSLKVHLFRCINCGHQTKNSKPRLANSQCSKAWWVVSSSLLQIGHLLLVLMPRVHIFSFMGNPLTQALQTKILIFVGRLRSHRFFQRGLRGKRP